MLIWHVSIFDLGDFILPVEGLQWLTLDPDPMNQSWATSITLPYSRTAYRLTIDIPDEKLKNLLKADEFSKAFFRKTEDARAYIKEYIQIWPGSESWYIFKGEILPKWITNIEKQKERQLPNNYYLDLMRKLLS